MDARELYMYMAACVSITKAISGSKNGRSFFYTCLWLPLSNDYKTGLSHMTQACFQIRGKLMLVFHKPTPLLFWTELFFI